MRRSHVVERLDGTALGLVAPVVGHGPDAVDPERGRDVAGHGVGIDEQDRLALARLDGGSEVGGDRRLADPALGVEHGYGRRAPVPGAGSEVAALEDRPAAVVDGLAPDAHRLDAPAARIGGVGAGEVLVARAGGLESGETVEGP